MRWVAYAFLGLVIELWLLVGLGRVLGGEALFGWVLGTALVGVLLVRYEGLRVVSSLRRALSELHTSEQGVTSELLLLVGAVLLILPGVLGDLLGTLLLLPPLRNKLARVIQQRLERHLDVRAAGFVRSPGPETRQRRATTKQSAPRSGSPRVHTPRGRGGTIDVEGELIEER